MARVDLHMHSSVSDGSDSAEELVKRIEESGISVFSLTDHDAAEGCPAVEKAVSSGISFIYGIEFSCQTAERKCHILGYNYRYGHPAVENAIDAGRKRRRENLERRLVFLRDTHGIVFSEEELAYFRSLDTVGKPHLAKAIVEQGAAGSIDEAIQRYLHTANPGESRIEAFLAVTAIREAGGIPVWAHPLGGEGESHLSIPEFEAQLQILLDYGIRGLECYYSRYSDEEIDFLLNVARQKGLLISGGSDYHGTNKSIALGELNLSGRPVDSRCLTILDEIQRISPKQS